MNYGKKIVRAMLLSVIIASIACFESNAVLGSISLSDRSEAERISGQRLRSAEVGNPGSSSSVDEGALRLAEQIAGQRLRSAEVGNPGSSSSVDEGALRLAEQIAGQPLRLVGK